MKKTLFVEYTAPEMEIISTVVEAGFEGSGFTSTIESSDELEGGSY